ncbi:LytTR family transcriptional regulator [Breoghania corrubedonensis]|uniref:LytTR family transcriptional regulator n=1 Tax=Breoghania corrubedonensis TaxID=665038 RepID=A0A2T5V1G5_9HYPH|nr:LytTR family DNA-binding domain-containing protein [Breoghania corrubedonensis]PTW57599.1 LytTR family transcriptional regulator [Breoghania corrubedonensis]
MNDTTAQSAFRKWYRLLRSSRFWEIVAVAAIVTLAGNISFSAPIGETAALMLLHFAIAVVSSTVASFGIVFVSTILSRRLAVIPRFALAGLVASPAVFGVVFVLIAIAHRTVPDRSATLDLLVSVTIIVTAISLAIALFESRGESKAPTPLSVEPSQPQFVKRLPVELGQDLTRLSACDHYVEAYTRKGHALVLIRFSDALKELAEEDGLQIHRSHWVARTAVHRLVNEGRSLLVEMEDGARLPVSRSRLAAVRAEGFPVDGKDTRPPA